jgi:hypothetical protein
VIAVVNVQSQKAEIDLTGSAGARLANTQTPLLAALPGDSWAAFGAPRVGQSLRTAIDNFGTGLGGAVITALKNRVRTQTGLDIDNDVFAAIGDLAGFARGTSALTVGGGVVIQSPSPAAARRLVAKLRPLVGRLSNGRLRTAAKSLDGASGIQITGPRFPGAINAVVRGDRLVIAYTDAATREALSPASSLGRSQAYRRAQQALGGIAPSFLVAFQPITQLLEAVGTSRRSLGQARETLSTFDIFAVGARQQGDEQVARLVLSLR